MIKKIFFAVVALLSLNSVVTLSCRKDLRQYENKPPIAVAGDDAVVLLPFDSVKLDGRASSDPDGNIKEYLWTKISGPSSFLFVNPDSATAIMKNLTNGVYLVELKVSDDGGLSAKDTLMITADSVATSNHPPISNAGSDQTISTAPDFLFDGITVLLDGSKSLDPDSNIYSYQWSMISGAPTSPFSGPKAAQTQVSFFEYGSYQFELKVTDSGGLSSSDTVSIIIEITDTAQQPPIASAGQDQIIFLPVNTITLNGSASADPNNNIIAYQWTKVSGPSSFNMADPYAAQTQATSLVEGVYQFELKVTDATSLSSVDTVTVIMRTCGANRPKVNANLTAFGQLPNPRYDFAVAAAANKIVFAGGVSADEPYGSSKVDIYDMITQTWSTANLSVPRFYITAIAAGNKILFAGGFSGEVGDLEYYHSTIDIYDATTNTWSVDSMNKRCYGMSAATVGHKVLFAGGYVQSVNNTTTYGWSNTVELYDISTKTWSTSYLNETKEGISAVTLNNKVYLAGGRSRSSKYSDKVDIYDNGSNTWSTTTLSTPRLLVGGGIAFSNKIFWAGGVDDLGETCKVEIKDVQSQATAFDNLSAAGFVKAILMNDKIVYCGYYDKELDVYDINAKTWAVVVLPNFSTSLLAVNNAIYLINPNDNTQMIWKLEF